MEELKEMCEAADPIKLSPYWELLAEAKELLHKYNYVEDPEDPNSFFKQVPAGYTDTGISTDKLQPEAQDIQVTSIKLPSVVPEVSCLPPASHFRVGLAVRVGSSDSVVPEVALTKWKQCNLIQIDSSRLPLEHQVWVIAEIPKQPKPKEQPVVIRIHIQPHVKLDADLCVHLQVKPPVIGVLRNYMLLDSISVGYYPSFIRFTLTPLLDDRYEVALPLYTQGEKITDEGDLNRGFERRTTVTKLGTKLGWGPISFTTERAWGAETDVSRETQKLVTVTTEEGNAASMEWSVLRWIHNGTKYNAKKPHAGIWPMLNKPLRVPFGGGGTIPWIDGFPGIVWHLRPEYAGKIVKFMLHLEVEMHLVWFVGESKFFRLPGSASTSFEFKREVEVQPINRVGSNGEASTSDTRNTF